MLSSYDKKSKKIRHISANACLVLLASLHGTAVTTIEGIGSIKTKLHPVQERLAKAHGTQCGFCSPGFVMSMYTLLRNSPFPTIEEVEENLVGNLCRCTGYRPILDAFRTFCQPEAGCGRPDCCKVSKNTHAKTSNACCKSSSDCSNNFSCKNQDVEGLFDAKLFAPYSPTQDLIFPPELQISENFDVELHFSGPRVQYFRPVTFERLLILKSKHPDSKILAGNTEIGVDMKYKDIVYPVLIDISRIEEFKTMKLDDESIIFGAGLTFSQMEEYIQATMPNLPEYKTKVLKSLQEMMPLFAGKQIRNRGTIGGNICKEAPISDLIPILIASETSVYVDSLDSGTRQFNLDENFYAGYRQTVLKPQEVLVSLKIPFTLKNECFKWYKQSRRRRDDVAIVNVAFKAQFTDGTNKVKDIKMVYGGMDKKVVVPLETSEALKGLNWDDTLLEKAILSLGSELKLHPGAPRGMTEYRQSVVVSLFVRFHLFVRRILNGEDISLSVALSKSEAVQLEMDSTKSKPFQTSQVYQKVSSDQNPLDPVGRTIPHASSMKHVTGEAHYVDDTPRLQNELAGAFVTSEIACGIIDRIDTTAAMKIDGVKAFFCSKDLPADRNLIQPDETMFADQKVKCVGQIIGILVAEDQEIAIRAAKEVKVHYKKIEKPILTIEEAIKANSLWEPDVISQGNVQTALASCHHILEGDIHIGGQEHFYLEPNAHLAVPKDTDELEIFSSCQAPKTLQETVAKVLNLQCNRILVRIKRVGGAFGGKQARAVSVAAPAAFAAHSLQQPVRVVLNRHQDMQMTGGRHPMLAKWKVGFQEDGKLQAIEASVYINAGWCLELSKGVVTKSLFSLHGPYNIPNRRLVGYCCKTNLPSNTAFRGFGIPQSTLVMEDIITRVADYLLIDGNQIRLRNISPPHVPVNSTDIESSIVNRCWSEVIKMSNYEERLKEIKDFNRQSQVVKRGISAIPISYGIGYYVTWMQQAGALVLVYADGSVLLTHGGVELGQGLHTKMLQVASRVLQIPIDRIFTSEYGSDRVPNPSVSAASVSSDLNGMAVVEACQKILDRLSPYKEKMPVATWNDWVDAAYMDRVSLAATGFYKTPYTSDYNNDEQKGDPFSYRTYGAAVSEVTVDCLTGNFTLLRTDIVMDVGKSLNPGIDVGQIEGGFLQGMGWLTLEELKYSPNGKLLTLGPGMYKIPSLNDIPRSFNVRLVRNSINTKAVNSSKGIGEPPLLLATSVYSAIKGAIKSYRKSCGVETLFRIDAPLTVERIRLACPDAISKQIKGTTEEKYTPWSLPEV